MPRRWIDAPRVLRPEDVTAIIDSREQLGYNLAPLRAVPGTLDTADYSVKGLEAVVRIERKTLPDFVQCVGRERSRFIRELTRLRGFAYRLIIVEASWHDLEAGRWEGLVKPSVVVGSVLSWSAEYVPILLAGDRAGGQRACRGFLWTAARHTFQITRAFASTLATSASA